MRAILSQTLSGVSALSILNPTFTALCHKPDPFDPGRARQALADLEGLLRFRVLKDPTHSSCVDYNTPLFESWKEDGKAGERLLSAALVVKAIQTARKDWFHLVSTV